MGPAACKCRRADSRRRNGALSIYDLDSDDGDATMIFFLFAAAAVTPSAPTPLTPIGSIITPSDYPAGAMQHGVTGRVGFRLRVDTTGKPDGCVVWQTSGSTELDNATCDVMLARARFKPALGPSGEPVRGDFQARLAWTLDNQPETVTNEVIRVRSELDAAGRVVSCTAAPPQAAAEIGGCTLFGDPRMLGHLARSPLTSFSSIEMRMVKQASDAAPVADAVPTGAVKIVLARSTLTIAPAGTISGCTNDVVTRFDGRPIDLCAIGQVDPDAKFTAAATSQPRQLSITMETVLQPR